MRMNPHEDRSAMSRAERDLLHYMDYCRIRLDDAGRLRVDTRTARRLNFACLVALITGVGAPIGLALSAWAIWEWWQVGRAERALQRFLE